jgi:hypothetical protein
MAAGDVLSLSGGANIQALAGSSIPCLDLPFNVLAFSQNSYMSNAASPGQVMVDIPPAATLILYIQQVSNSGFTNGLVSGPIGSTLLQLADATFPIGTITFPGFLGTLTSILTDKASAVLYDDSKQTPALGTTDVQSTLDAFKTQSMLTSGVNAMAGTLDMGLQSVIHGHQMTLSSGQIDSTGAAIGGFAYNCNPSRTGVGIYNIVFNITGPPTPPTANYAVTVSAEWQGLGNPPLTASVDFATQTGTVGGGFNVYLTNPAGVLVDSGFSFMVIGEN